MAKNYDIMRDDKGFYLTTYSTINVGGEPVGQRYYWTGNDWSPYSFAARHYSQDGATVEMSFLKGE